MESTETARLFDQWALNGRAEGMERGHQTRAVQALEAMPISLDDKLLDLGCGNGWASRWLRAKTGSFGFVAGVDASAEMVALAKQVSSRRNSVQFRQALFEDLPWADGFFDHAFSMEALYYALDLDKALGSVARVLRPGGSLTVCIDFYEENPHCHGWQQMMGIPMLLLSEAQWRQALVDAGLVVDDCFRCYDSRAVDPGKSPEEQAAELHFRTEVGSLALRAVKA
ncbi:MAG: SAM-dependent methyltransferase [Rickettsiales bacterium]|nr:SAM-dependent methyltransferase [Rickettsiales bacterium]|tara:strand:- start:1701 stop:2378 length:678 start_codon:yes stop_codon:yes gene_type:complete